MKDTETTTAYPNQMRFLKYIVVYPAYSINRVREEEGYISRIRQLGYDIESFGIPCPEGWWTFPKLDVKWRQKSFDLMTAYESLSEKLRAKDVLIASGGSMLHPEFISQLSTFNIFICADDPESSEILSKPVAPFFDFSFTVNIGCLDMYRSWGCKNVDWLFQAIRPDMTDASITPEQILNGERDIDVIFVGARHTCIGDRLQRADKLLQIFPQAFFAGSGWPRGRLEGSVNAYYARAKIGWNFNNNNIATNNTRTWHLPAMGVMQICDNKRYLNKIFTLDEEIVGYYTVEECAEKTMYYLKHDKERREIAYRGWKRALKDYTEQKWWERILFCTSPFYLKNIDYSKSSKLTYSITQNLSTHYSDISVDSASRRKVKNILRPRILLLADRPGWAFDTVGKSIAHHLSDEFEFKIEYVIHHPDLSKWHFDIIYVLFWGETYHQRFINDPQKVIKQIASHRWAEKEYGSLTPGQMVDKYLQDASTISVISKRLQKLISPYREVFIAPNGIDPEIFKYRIQRNGYLKIGWAGNDSDPCKGLNDILKPAAGNEFELYIAGGNLSPSQMVDFYNSLDLICVASKAEGGPLPLLEAMACGCFPVCVNVGIVPEVIIHRRNGMIIDRSIAAFRAAFQWCYFNTDFIRHYGLQNARQIGHAHSWPEVSTHWRKVIKAALEKKN
jgi:spore maturation protein CgeB